MNRPIGRNMEIKENNVCGKCNKPKGETEESCNCGRPSKYSQEMLEKTIAYIDDCEDGMEQLVKQSGDNKNGGYESFENKLKVKIPSIEGLAFELEVNKTTLYEWEQVYPEFSNTLNKLRAKQAKELINKGLSGDYNSTIAKLILSSNHGYKERTDTTSNDKDLIPETLTQEEKEALLSLIK